MKPVGRRYSALLSALPWIAGAFVAVGLKYYYSRSSSDGLLWMLYPTSCLVGQISSLHFVRVANIGFVDHARGIAIVQACAGVNFLIILFCTLFFTFLSCRTSNKARWGWLLTVLASSYVLTVAVNSLRIAGAVYLHEKNIQWGWLTAARVHRIEGLTVYFLSLTAIYLLARKIASPRPAPHLHRAAGDKRSRVIRASTPFFWYAIVAVAIPVLDSVFRRSSQALLEHSGTVIILTGILSLAAASVELYFGRIPFKIGKKILRKKKWGGTCKSRKSLS